MSEIDVAWWVGEAIADLKTWQFGVTAGLGSGKTHGVDQWHFDRCLKNQEAAFSAQLWPTYQKIYDAAIPTYEKVLQQFGLEKGKHFRVLRSPYPKVILTFLRPRHEIHFLSGEEPDRIVASEYSHASEHESGIIIKEASENLRSRVRDPRSKVLQVVREGVPQGLNNFADDFDSRNQTGWIEVGVRDWTKTDVVEGQIFQRRRFQVYTDDNPHTTPMYKAIVQDTFGHNAAMIRSYRYGDFVDLAFGSAYANYFPQLHDVADVGPSPSIDIDLTWDFNANPLAWISVQRLPVEHRFERRFQYTAVHEANESNTQLDDACVEFAEKHPVELFRDTPIYIWGDSTGHHDSHKTRSTDYKAIKRYLEELGYRRVKITAAISNPLETDSVDYVNRGFSGGYLALCKRCRMLRRSLTQTTWAEGKRKLLKKAKEKHTHHGDAWKYFVFGRLKNEIDNRIKINGLSL
jgi:hypothetical protein